MAEMSELLIKISQSAKLAVFRFGEITHVIPLNKHISREALTGEIKYPATPQFSVDTTPTLHDDRELL